jgi:cytochrome c2
MSRRPGARPSLRRQFAWLLSALALVVAVVQAAFVYWSAERWEEQVIDAITAEQLRLSMAQYAHDPTLAAPNTPDMRLYVSGPDEPETLPEYLAQLPPASGAHEIFPSPGIEYHVAVGERDGRRFYLVYDVAEHEQRQGNVLAVLAASVIVIALVVLAGSDRLARRLTDDLERLADASRERWRRSNHGAMLLRILPDRVRPSQLPQADSRGARLVALYCVQCHNLPDPAMHDAGRWPEVVRRMVPRMEGRGNLGPLMADLMRAPGAGERAMTAPTADEERAIVAYLQQHAQRGLDVNADAELARALDHGAGRMFAEACSQCHALPDPSQHTAEEWPPVVERMRDNLEWMNRVQSGSDPREPQLSVPEIVGFLQQHAKR